VTFSKLRLYVSQCDLSPCNSISVHNCDFISQFDNYSQLRF